MPISKTAAFYDAQKRLATEHAVFEDTGKHEPVRAASTDTGEGLLLSSFTVLRLGAAQKACERSGESAHLLAQKGRARAEDRHAEVSEGRDVAGRLQKQLTAALLELAKVQEELDK